MILMKQMECREWKKTIITILRVVNKQINIILYTCNIQKMREYAIKKVREEGTLGN